MSESRPKTGHSFTDTPGQWWRNILVPALPLLACFLGGATEKWSEGIVVAILGIILLADPPRFSLGPVLNLILFSILVCAAFAFLPAHWFPQPNWRTAFIDFGIKMPDKVSPQPWMSLGCFVSLLAGMSWLYYVSTIDLDLRSVRQQLRLFTAGVALLAGLSLALYQAQVILPFWNNQTGFGPFPNRNQTANLFGLSGILIIACGQDAIRRRKKSWIIWLIGLGLIVAAIVTNLSRAGIALFIAGIALWLVAFVVRKRSVVGIALAMSALLILLTVMLIFGGQTLERFHLRSDVSGEMATDLRWAIFRDAFQLISASPWCGIGLGNFDGVFALFRNASLSTAARTIHPENDWLWVWAETGWLTIPLILVGFAFFIRLVFPLHEGTNQRFRLATLIAVILFALHGLVDVSGHRVGTAYAGIFLLGMALRRPVECRVSKWLAWTFRLIGLVIFLAGMAWIIGTRNELSLPGAVGVEVEMRKASAANQARDFNDAMARTTRALEWAPLKWQLYFSRAIGRVGGRRPRGEAEADFRRARFLEPNAYEVPYQEGIVWLARDPTLTVSAWREAIRRVGAQRVETYAHMLTMAPQEGTIVHRGLEEIGLASPDLALVYLQRATGTDFNGALRKLIEQNPRLDAFSSDERGKLFALWAERGDSDNFLRTVEAHPDWMQDAWLSVARVQAKRKRFREACEIVRRFSKPPTLPQAETDVPLEQLRQKYATNPDNAGIGYQLYREDMKAGLIDDALAIVRHFTERPDSPRYFSALEAEAWAGKGNWERAWNAWDASVRQ